MDATMTWFTLVWHTLRYHARSNLAVLFGVAVGTAVLTGAFVVGDSLRGSLRARGERQLGFVDYALVSPRLLRTAVADELSAARVEPTLVIRGVLHSTDGPPQQAGQVSVYGVRPTCFPDAVRPGGLTLSADLAQRLGVRVGGTLLLTTAKLSQLPRESLLSKRDADSTTERVRLPVVAILPVDHSANEFSLAPGTGTPRNVFLPLGELQTALGLDDRVNALLVSGGEITQLRTQLHAALTLDDWGLQVQTPSARVAHLSKRQARPNPVARTLVEDLARKVATAIASRDQRAEITPDQVRGYYAQRGYFAVEATQMLLEPAIVAALERTAAKLDLPLAPTSVYLANTIRAGTQELPYSVVAALDPQQPPTTLAALGPLADDEIVVVTWPGAQWSAAVGTPITLDYFHPEQEGRLQERSASFKLKALVPLDGALIDPDLTPAFPGITDKLTLAEWDPPFPYEGKRIRKRDEQYWDDYRTTPKAYISRAAGKKLWGSRFGDDTSVRVGQGAFASLDDAGAAFAAELRTQLDPVAGGMHFDDVRQRLQQASVGGTDFTGLFLGFSCFLIAAALLLVGLLVRLNVERRAAQVGLLLAVGYPLRMVQGLLLAEGALVAALGGLLGSVGAVVYAGQMLAWLAWLWPSGQVGDFLRVQVQPTSLLVGYGLAVGLSGLAMWWAVRGLRHIAPVRLLRHDTAPPLSTARAARWSQRVSLVGLLIAGPVALSGANVRDPEAQAGMFFGGGALALIGGLALVWRWLAQVNPPLLGGRGLGALGRLGIRNAQRQPLRGVLTAGLVATAAFLLVAVEAFRRSPLQDFAERTGGSGGFALRLQADVPLYEDLNGAGQTALLDAIEQQYAKLAGDERKAKLHAAQSVLASIDFVPLRVQPGDDASCQNLYQAGRPRMIGVPSRLVERGGFRFASTLARTPAEVQNPWLLLERPPHDGAVPVFGEANSLTYMLKKGLGDTLSVPDGRGQSVQVQIVGILKDSLFQSELLTSETHFTRLYPQQEGYPLFLVDTQGQDVAEVQTTLLAGLGGRGVVVERSIELLAGYLAVQNAYLTTFQLLGGLGLLLGVLGLTVVLLRGVWERRAELALLQAVGYPAWAVQWIVLAENASVLLAGLLVGTLAAGLAVAPHLWGGATVDGPRLAGLLAGAAGIGLFAAALAVRGALGGRIVAALRQE
jgi:ABC-type lipoprotein release transport system permease subunit